MLIDDQCYLGEVTLMHYNHIYFSRYLYIMFYFGYLEKNQKHSYLYKKSKYTIKILYINYMNCIQILKYNNIQSKYYYYFRVSEDSTILLGIYLFIFILSFFTSWTLLKKVLFG